MDTISLSFKGGMNNKSQETKVPEGQARRIVNFDIDNLGRLVKRSGVEKVYSGADVHSLWNCPVGTFFFDENALYRFDLENGHVQVKAPVANLPISYAHVNGVVYWCNGAMQGAIVDGATAIDWSPGIVGEQVRYYNGRLYVARGNTIYPTDAMNYGSIDMLRNFISMPGDITMVAPVSGGIYIGVNKMGTYFLSGADYKTFNMSMVNNIVPIRGTDVYVPGNEFGVQGDACAWMTRHGWSIGSAGGQVTNPTYDSTEIGADGDGASLLRKHNGLVQLVGFVNGSGSGAAASDSVTTEVIRGGKLLV